MAVALFALLPLSASAQTVLGVYMFHRHGDRTPKALAPANLTDLGYREVVTSGTYYRNRYVASDAPLRIAGINTDLVKLSQLSVSAPADNVLMSSAIGFTQALYPAVSDSSQTLANGSVIQAPMNGYQIIPVATASDGAGSEDKGWLQGSSDCANAEVSSNGYFYSSEYQSLYHSTMDFYQRLDPVINLTFNATSTTFKNAYTIFDYIKVAEIHNASIPSSDLLDTSTLFQLRTLADNHEFNLAYNASSTTRAIDGAVMAAQVVDFLNTTITGEGKSKLGIQFGAYGNMQSFFGLANLTATAGDMFYGVPDYASNLIWELYTNETVSDMDALVDTDNLHVRFLFHNGTTSNISEPQLYPLFGQSDIDLSWNDFVEGMNKFAIGTTEDYCMACGNTTGICAPTSSSSSSGSSGSLDSDSTGGAGGISNAVAGVIGAMVTLGVVLLIEGLVLLLGGFRLVTKKRLAAGRNVANGGGLSPAKAHKEDLFNGRTALLKVTQSDYELDEEEEITVTRDNKVEEGMIPERIASAIFDPPSTKASSAPQRAVPGYTHPYKALTARSLEMSREYQDMNIVAYDFLLWMFSVVLDLFFREIHPRSTWKIPRKGPVIFVAAPHANQFIDPLILMRTLRNEVHRRPSLLIAEKSMKRKWIGYFSKRMGALSVGRALDSAHTVPGRVYLPDPDGEPTIVRGVGTNFESHDFQIGGLIVLSSVKNVAANAEISEIHGPEELKLKKPMSGAVAIQQLTGRRVQAEDGKEMNGDVESQVNKSRNFEGTTFKVAPKVDQTKVYDTVFDKLSRGGAVGIFPEGGSHDRTELLPLKAGVAIMALGAMAANPNCNLQIVPCGMNYFHAHKFRSRAVIEFGTPIEVPSELVQAYKSGQRREAVGQMLEIVYNALVAVTVTSPDYDTLMLIQAVRRLYNPKGKRLPLPMVVELNRRLVRGYTRFKDEPRIIALKKGVLDYNKKLFAINVRDHQIEYAKLSVFEVVATLIYRLGKLAVLSIGVLPGLVLFAPVFVVGKMVSIKKSKEALAASTVKIQAHDVVATWKLLVSLALAPTLYVYYTVLLGAWTYYNRVQGIIPPHVPIWTILVPSFIFFVAITFAALRFGEIGMDVAKSLRPLVLCLNPSSGNTLVKLRKQREELAAEVTNLINDLGPKMFPDFDAHRLIGPEPETAISHDRGRTWSGVFNFSSPGATSPSAQNGGHARASSGAGSSMSGGLPRNESFTNLASFGFFASQPPTPTTHSRQSSHSRPSSRGSGWRGSLSSPIKAFSTLNSKEDYDDVSQKIRGAMRERGQRRVSSSVDGSLEAESESEEDESSGVSTPASDGPMLKKNL
ncbi:MAG: hypothetical protein M1828_002450 [Chrysothrix sp. TS-e1954]|nr:MAG: hypothetical protein M1828_002450 [Chrysothrix sp. TS-e1954]